MNNKLTGLGADHPANGPLTIERLTNVRDVLQRKLKYSNGGSMDYIIADAVKAIDELLEVRNAEPVAWTDEQELRDVEKDGLGYLFTVNPITPHADPRRVIKLYTAQPAPVTIDERAAFNAWNNEDNLPIAGVGAKNAAWLAWQARARLGSPTAPVVPEEATPDNIEILASARVDSSVSFQWDEDERNAAADSWNACRAAMLNGGKS